MMKKKSPPNANTPKQYRSSLSLIVILPVFECSKDLHRRCRLRPLGTPLLLDHGHVLLMYIRVEQKKVFIEFIVRVLFTTQHIRIDPFRKQDLLFVLSFLFDSVHTGVAVSRPQSRRQFITILRGFTTLNNEEGDASFSSTMVQRPCLWVNKCTYGQCIVQILCFFLLTLLNSHIFLVFISHYDFNKLRVFVSFYF